MAAIDTAKAIQGLLNEHGVENDSLNTFIKEAENLPDIKTLDTFNNLVEEYQSANTFDTILRSGNELLEFYSSHAQELEQKAPEMRKLASVLEDFEQIDKLYDQLDAEIEDGDF